KIRCTCKAVIGGFALPDHLAVGGVDREDAVERRWGGVPRAKVDNAANEHWILEVGKWCRLKTPLLGQPADCRGADDALHRVEAPMVWSQMELGPVERGAARWRCRTCHGPGSQGETEQ